EGLGDRGVGDPGQPCRQPQERRSRRLRLHRPDGAERLDDGVDATTAHARQLSRQGQPPQLVERVGPCRHVRPTGRAMTRPMMTVLKPNASTPWLTTARRPRGYITCTSVVPNVVCTATAMET